MSLHQYTEQLLAANNILARSRAAGSATLTDALEINLLRALVRTITSAHPETLPTVEAELTSVRRQVMCREKIGT